MRWKGFFAAVALLAAAVLPASFAEAGHLEDIAARGTLRVGTTGDYRPMSYRDAGTGTYDGYDAELAAILADTLHVKVEYVPTTWPTLTADTQAGKFDIAICGISRTYDRARMMAMSDGYAETGKTILCRRDEAGRYQTLADLDKPEVRVMVNPGGTNERFAHKRLPHAQILVHEKNAEIPQQIADGNADIMITETFEARRYVRMNDRLAAPLVDAPFTRSAFGVLMGKGDQELLNYVNFVLEELEEDGTLRRLEAKYLE